MKSLRTILLGSALLLSGCNVLPTACTDELGFEIRPAERTIAVGESVVPTATEVTCSGRIRTPLAVTWYADDATVVRVDSVLGMITGLKAGRARVEAFTDMPVGSVEITVVR
ncbi:hypothetical protein BH23GEM8_BH23GEM8_22760 [soil metagenome]